MRMTVLYGTETGNAEMCADSVASYLRERDAVDVDVYDMADAEIDVLSAPGFFVFITSTFGEGELPEGAEAFFTALEAASPDLGHVNAAVFGLGDSYYDGTFNRGGHLAAERLEALGASLLGDIGCYDTSSGEPPEDKALEWAKQLPVLQAT